MAEDRLLKLKDFIGRVGVVSSTWRKWSRDKKGTAIPKEGAVPVLEGTPTSTLLLRGSGGQPNEKIRPSLHHLAALGNVLRPVVRCTHLVFFNMRKLALDDIRAPAHFIQKA